MLEGDEVWPSVNFLALVLLIRSLERRNLSGMEKDYNFVSLKGHSNRNWFAMYSIESVSFLKVCRSEHGFGL